MTKVLPNVLADYASLVLGYGDGVVGRTGVYNQNYARDVLECVDAASQDTSLVAHHEYC